VRCACGSSVRGWGLTLRGLGPAAARAEGVDVAYALELGGGLFNVIAADVISMCANGLLRRDAQAKLGSSLWQITSGKSVPERGQPWLSNFGFKHGF